MALKDIEHIVFVMLENRSFDHMLGYLSLQPPPAGVAVNGFRPDKAWMDSWTNLGDGVRYPLYKLDGGPEIQDPPHGSARIRQQIHSPTADGAQPLMGGFVQSYLDSRRIDPRTGQPLKKQKKVKKPGAVMGYHDSQAVPTFDFFARNFCVCDNWFTPLPLGTQANRLMAMSGESKISDNDPGGFPDQDLVYHWIEGVLGKDKWRAYTWGGFVPFFTLMPRMRGTVANGLCGKGPFKRFSKLERDWKTDPAMPPLIFIEPEYSDGIGKEPNDDHPPIGVEGGQRLLNRIYQVLTSNPTRWAKTLMIVTYDEHGGFFDHVNPLPIKSTAGKASFTTTGPRVPALLVSQHVAPGSVFSEPLDHTSFLQLLDDWLNQGKGYTPAVTTRTRALGGRLANALKPPRPGPAPRLDPVTEFKSGRVVGKAVHAWVNGYGYWAPDTPTGVAYDDALRTLVHEHREILDNPENKDIADYIKKSPPPRAKHFDHIG